jgi:MHS family alpha-ketoglutarate permease-like MFS transporter
VAGNVIRGSLGNLIEWYDWYAYAAFSIYFASVFFPSGNPTAQLMNRRLPDPPARGMAVR